MKQKLKRTRRLILLVTLGLTSVLTENIYAQTCSAPIPLTINNSDTISVSDSIVWLSLNSGTGATWGSISISLPQNEPALLNAELYSGTCTSLTLVQSGFQDIGEFLIRSNIAASTTYLVKVTRSGSSNTQLYIRTNVTTASPPCQPCTTQCELVCNGDLETYVLPDNQQHAANFASTNVCSWGSPGASTPDYYIANPNVDPRVQASNNFTGTETPHSGNSYAGIYCYYYAQGQYREYIQHQLQQPLVAGQWYTLTFWVSLADYSGHTVNDLGAYISATQPQQQFPTVLNVMPQVVMNPALNIPTNGWVPISGSFQATAGMQWITIGSFEPDQTQQHPLANPFPTINNPYYPNPPSLPHYGAYYYIDDISIQVPDPCFTWQGCSPINFYNNVTPCNGLIISESWDFGDPGSGPSNFSTSANPSHIFSQNNVTYTVTHTIQTAVTSYTCSQQVTPNPPVASITGYTTNNCGVGTITYTAPCIPGVIYTWSVTNGTMSNITSCSVDVDWFTIGGTLTLTAQTLNPDCSTTTTLVIPPCEHCPGLEINNHTSSWVLSNPLFAPYIVPNTNIVDFTQGPPQQLVMAGVFTIDVPITFINWPDIKMGSNTPVIVNPGQNITFSKCTLDVCDEMWDGIYVSDPSSSVVIKNNSLVRQAKNVIVSNNGGNFKVEDSKFESDYKGIVVNPYTGTHQGRVTNTDFTMGNPFVAATPALPFGHTKTVCGIEIHDNASIKIGDGTQLAYRNRFYNILVGVRSEGSSTTVENASFYNMLPTLPQSVVPNAGTGIVSTGGRSFLFPLSLKVGGATGFQQCSFNNMLIAIDCYEPHPIDINSNAISKVRMSGIRISRDRSSTITVSSNSINNIGSAFGFQTAIRMVECYQSNIQIFNNQIKQATAVPQQVGTGIRVALATPGDVLLNVFGNTIDRTRIGILTEQLVGKNHVFITSNTINFQKPNPQYAVTHTGIYLMRCNTVSVRYNTVTKTGANPNNALLTMLNGVYLESSTGSLVSHNTFIKMGSGVFGWETCTNSILACNTLDHCFYGFRFDGLPDLFDPNGGCDISNQILDLSGNPIPTGNTWIPLGVPQSTDIGGDIFPMITWYCEPNYCPTTILSGNSITGNAPVSLQGFQNTGCTIPQYAFPPIKEREINVGQTVQTPVPYSNEKQFSNERDAHRKLRNSPSWMTLGTPQDSLYSSFYTTRENSNIGLFRNFEDMAAVDSAQASGNILATISGTNTSENNLNVVYSIYQQVWMHGQYEFSSADSATLYAIATQPAANAGEAVYAARVMLDMLVDEYAASALRLAPGSTPEDAMQQIKFYPNPANSVVNGSVLLEEGTQATVTITDLQGKVVLTQLVSGTFTIDVSTLEAGLYLLQTSVNGVLIETEKLEVIHE